MNTRTILLSAFIVVIIGLGVWYLFGFKQTPSDTTNISQETSSATCADSDNGKDIYTTGSAETRAGKNSYNTGEVVHIGMDVCAEKLANPTSSGAQYVEGVDPCSGENCYVRESFCGEDPAYPEMGLRDMKEYLQCPNGCNNGACVSP